MVDEPAKMDVQRLVADYHAAVYRYAYRLTGSAADAEDLTQHVFLVAQEKLEQLRRAESARGWLFTILRNHWLRTVKRQEALSATSIGLNLDALPSNAEDVPDIDSARLQEALGQLSAEFRIIVAMFYFEDCSYREIAEKLDLPMGTVMSRLARAKGQLRSTLFEPESVLPRASKSSPAR